jgi:hypothetical protein
VISACRPTIGPVKAVVAVTKSLHSGFAYDLFVNCNDKFGNAPRGVAYADLGHQPVATATTPTDLADRGGRS